MMKKYCYFFTFIILHIASNAFSQEEAQLRDVKPPVYLPTNIWGYLLWLLAIIVCVGVLVALFRLKRRNKTKSPPTPPTPPWVIAYARIERLKTDNLIPQGKVKEYFSRLSDIVRHYLEDRFSLRAPEMTTEEFLWKLRDSHHLNSYQKEFLREFLSCCDMAKFAKYLSSAIEMEQSMGTAIRLIDETKDTSEALIK